MYSAVYKCVCKHQAERLHSDLMCHVESIVKKWSQSLHHLRQSGDSIGFIREFHQILTQFFSALASIVPIFIYLVSTILHLWFIHYTKVKYQIFLAGLKDMIETNHYRMYTLNSTCYLAYDGLKWLGISMEILGFLVVLIMWMFDWKIYIIKRKRKKNDSGQGA